MAHRRSTPRSPARRPTSSDVVPNQVFVGLPWSARGRYEHVLDRLRIRSALAFVIVGRNDRQDAEDLLVLIKERIESSSYGIFDATAGNPNVSLEYGYAEAIDLPRVLYLSTHGGGARRTPKDAPIIADLAGKRRNQYKQERALARLLARSLVHRSVQPLHAVDVSSRRCRSQKARENPRSQGDPQVGWSFARFAGPISSSSCREMYRATVPTRWTK